MNVSVKEITTGSTSKITITKDKLSLSSEEIERMVKDAETYKAKDDEHRKKSNARKALVDYACK